jgi:large subunit ribosomal protein L25
LPDLTLKAAKRDILGKKTRFLRRQGITPTHLLGHGIKSLALQCDTAELKRTIAQGGTTRIIELSIEAEKRPRSVFIREIQRDEINGKLLHVDFYQVKKTEKITADIPIALVGEATATKSKENMLEQLLTQLGVECLPEKLPPQIEVDLSSLEEAGQAIHVKDIALDPYITVTTDPDQIIVKVSRVRVAVEEEEVVAVAEEEVVPAEAEAEVVPEAEKPAEEER